jgi:hypothetical protein
MHLINTAMEADPEGKTEPFDIIQPIFTPRRSELQT